MQPLKFILSKNLKESGLGGKIQKAMVIEFFKKQLVHDFGQAAVESIKTFAIRNDRLNIAMDSSAFKQEISLRESKYLQELAREFGPGTVAKITFYS